MHGLRSAPLLALTVVTLLTACQPAAAPQPAPRAAAATALQPMARTAEALDVTTPAQRQAALAPAPAGAVLGRVTVSLGAPAEPGFWLRSGLVGAERAGRVAANGRSVAVTLRPGDGAAQLSLAAYRALGLSLTDLPEVTVHGG